MVEFLPLRALIRREAQLPGQAAPHFHGRFHRNLLEGASGVQPLQQHGTGAGVGLQEQHRTVAVPEPEGETLNPGFVVRVGNLQDGRDALAGDRDNHAAVAIPGQLARFEVHLKVPPLQASADQSLE
ncbi:hypothetical protein D9M72_439010 [compost metagenome]